MRILYISYDGALEPLGRSQVVAYLQPLAAHHDITLLSYEKSRDMGRREAVRHLSEALVSRGIRWIRLRYHKWPSIAATGFDVLAGIFAGLVVCRRYGVHIVHARGYVPSLIALALKRLCGAAFLFDMRGFWPEEKAEAGHWSRRSLAYRLAKRWERRFFEQADAIVSLTEAGVRAFPSLGYAIPERTPVEVIPTCADLEQFRPGGKEAPRLQRLGLRGAPVIGCVGTLSNWYLREETLRYLARLLTGLPSASVLFVTREPHELLRRDAAAAGIPGDRSVVIRAEFAEMPQLIRLMDLGVFFIRVCFSKKASAATKLAEFLGTGVPVVINDGIGDSGDIVREHGAGVVLSDMAEAGWSASLEEVKRLLRDPETAGRCRRTAERHFDLRSGVKRYLELYDRLATVQHPEPQPPSLEPMAVVDKWS